MSFEEWLTEHCKRYNERHFSLDLKAAFEAGRIQGKSECVDLLLDEARQVEMSVYQRTILTAVDILRKNAS